jgi:GT2 family glycosyltransferase
MISLIIISFNSASIIQQCQQQLLDATPFPTFIIDNASPDGSAKILAEKFPKVEVVALEQNIGYGRAANVGLKKVQTRYALLLNPDLIATSEQIEKLLAHAQNDPDNTAIWGPASLKKDATGDPPQSVKWVSGCAMLFDMEKLNTIGLFDENIFLFAEETELCERTIKTGYQIKLCRDVYFDHLVGQASPPNPKVEYMKWWHFGWSQCYLMEKHHHTTWYKNPQRKLINYRIHSFTSSSSKKRKKWGAKADGAKAFLRGEKAFQKDRSARHSNFN